MAGERNAIDEAVRQAYGDCWREVPIPVEGLPRRSRADAGAGWRALRRDLPGLVAGTYINEDNLDALAASIVALFAPDDGDLSLHPLEQAVRRPVAAMVAAGAQPTMAVLDSLLAIVGSASPVLQDVHPDDPREPSDLASEWIAVTRMLIALLANRLADVVALLVADYGAGVVGDHVLGVEREDLQAHLADHYLLAADHYVRWQRTGGCRCREGRCSPEQAPKHHLSAWDPAAPGAAYRIDTWMRTWAFGQQSGAGVKPKAFEAGLVYRHLLRTDPSASVALVVGDVLHEVCIEDGCSKHLVKAHRVTRTDEGADGLIGRRVCATRNQRHDLAFAIWHKRAPREIVLHGSWSSHRRYGRLDWDAAVGRWRFVASGGVVRYLPLPHARPYQELCERLDPRPTEWTDPAVPLPPTPTLSWDDDAEPHDQLNDPSPPTEATAMIATTLAGAAPGGDLLAEVGAALSSLGIVDRDEQCRACDCPVPASATSVPPYCHALVEQTVGAYLDQEFGR